MLVIIVKIKCNTMGSVYVYTLSELFPITAQDHANAAIRIHTVQPHFRKLEYTACI